MRLRPSSGLTQDIQRVLSLTGVRPMSYPASQWVAVNRHAADIQDGKFVVA